MERRSGGRLIADALRAHGVERVFCVPGESYLALLDALYDLRDEIPVITCRHEHGAGFMAEATGKLTGRPGVCLVTRGPGACNASIAVHTAFQDSSPMLLVVGQVERRFQGREGFQEVDFGRMFAPLAKRIEVPETLSALPETLTRAFHQAVSGRAGPVVLPVAEDLLSETGEVDDVAVLPIDAGEPDPGSVERFHRILGDAERPIVIVGGSGWTRQARTDLAAFIAANELPTACSFRRLDIVDHRQHEFVGELGISPGPALISRIRAADLVIAVGTRLGEIVSQGYSLFGTEGQALVHVHPDPREPGRVFPVQLAMTARVAAFAACARRLAPVSSQRWRQWRADARAEYLADRQIVPTGDDLDPGMVMAVLDEVLPEDAIVTVDAGNFSGWPQRFLRFGGGRRLLGPCNGAMGYAVPAAVAAKLAYPLRTVVACVGDGGFGMTGQELSTALRYGIDPIVLVFDNGMYGTIRMHQERDYPTRVIGTGLSNPDFAALAEAFGAYGETVGRTEDFPDAFSRARAAGRAALLALRIEPERISTRLSLSALQRRAAAGG